MVKELAARPSLLIVDDTETNIYELVEFLHEQYEIAVAGDGQTALQSVAESPPDLILLDVMMEGMDGYQVCRRLKANERHRDIPVIFLTVLGETANLARGFEAGAVDYICRPYNLLEVRSRVGAHIALGQARRRLEQRHALLESMVAQRSRELSVTQDVAIHSLACLAETRDIDTGGHLLRTQLYVRLLAEDLARHPRFAGQLNEHSIELIHKSVPLHDIGKVGIPDAILLKPGRLSPEEFAVMKNHCRLGFEALLRAERLYNLPPETYFLAHAKDIAYCHHEKWDGSGYPRGLGGEQIPLSGRLMAVADVYDTLVGQRIYKPAMPHEQAVELIADGRGSHFDPDIVEAFWHLREQVSQIAQRFGGQDCRSQSGAELPGLSRRDEGDGR